MTDNTTLPASTVPSSSSSSSTPAERKCGFQVCFTSGEDPDYPATELNYHSPQTKGWQSPRFCEYPQEIGVAFLDGVINITQVQLLSHQHKIATRIEIFVGTGNDYLNCQFARLGYLSLDNNERSQYKARELKSVYLKAKGNFLKLLLHKCYINPLNLFSQVGLIAINILGSPVNVPGSSLGRGRSNIRAGGNAAIHDLAIDMGMDADTAAMLREVALRKEGAIVMEDYELAKKLKLLQDQIKHVGGKLAALANDKMKAVEDEDYDTASRIKDEMNIIRGVIISQMAELGMRNFPPPSASSSTSFGMNHHHNPSSMAHLPMNQPPPLMNNNAPPIPVNHSIPLSSSSLPPNNVNNSNDNNFGMGSVGPYRNPPINNAMLPPVGSADRPIRPAHGSDIYARAGINGTPDRDLGIGSNNNPTSPGKQLFDQYGRPISRQLRPARDNNIELAMEAESKNEYGNMHGDPDRLGTSPFMKRMDNKTEERPDPSQFAGIDNAHDLPAPEPLSAAAEKEAGKLIELFGEYITRAYYSREWHLREAAVLKMALDIQQGTVGQHTNAHVTRNDILSSMANALANTMARDRITNVFIAAATKLLNATLNACIDNQAYPGPPIRKPELMTALESVILGLVEKLGDNTPKVRETALHAIVEISAPEILGPLHIVTNFLLRKPSKKQASNLRGLQSRLEALTIIIETRGLLSPTSVGFGAETIVSYCHDNKTFEHANGDIRRTTLELCTAAYKAVGPAVEAMLGPYLRPKQMEEYRAAFAAATGRPLPPSNANANRNAAKANAGSKTNGASVASPTKGSNNNRQKANQHTTHNDDEQHQHGEETAEEDDGTCQFCGGCGPGTSEKDLDLHYWQACPMLMSCPKCQQVIEIATLNEHMLEECEAKADYEACPTCSDAFPINEIENHINSQICKPLPKLHVANRCPLCHTDIPPEREGWLQHLLEQGCPQNPRGNGKK